MNEKTFNKINGYQVEDAKARHDIENINIDIENIKIKTNTKRKFIFIGDSYGAGWTEEATYENWIEKTANSLGLVENQTYFRNVLGGVGFCNAIDNKTFLTLLTELIPSIEDENSITDIVVLGGYNDKRFESVTLNSAIDTFITTAKSSFPNAEIHIGEIGWSPVYSNRKQIEKTIYECYSSISSRGANFIDNIQFSTHNYEWSNDEQGHPNNEGQESIAKHLVQYLKTGSCNVKLQPKNISALGINAFVSVINDLVYLNLAEKYDVPVNNTLSTTPVELCEVPYIKGNSTLVFNLNCVLGIVGGTFKNAIVTFNINDGKLYAKLFEVADNGTSYKTIENVDHMQIPGAKIIFSSYDA